MKVRDAALTQKKDVKNDERSRNVYENKGNTDNMPDNIPDFWSENALVSHKLTQVCGHSGRKCADYAITRGKGGPRSLSEIDVRCYRGRGEDCSEAQVCSY